MQSEKVPTEMLLIDVGIFATVRDSHAWNAKGSIINTVVGICTTWRFLSLEKAYASTTVVVSGIFTWKASLQPTFLLQTIGILYVNRIWGYQQSGNRLSKRAKRRNYLLSIGFKLFEFEKTTKVKIKSSNSITLIFLSNFLQLLFSCAAAYCT